MAIVYGLTDEGLVRPTLTVIREQINDALRESFGASINLGDRSILGVLVGIFAERIAILWEILEQVINGLDPDKATKTLLDAIAAITGTFRPGPLPSTATLTLTGLVSTVVNAGITASTLSTGVVFKLLVNSAPFVALPAWTLTHLYAVGDRVTNVGRAYICAVAGLSDPGIGATGPTTTAAGIIDNTVTWDYLGDGVAAVDVAAESVDRGLIIAEARDISQIVNSVTGWSGVINIDPAIPGRGFAEDVDLRFLRVAELSGAGTGPFDAMIAALLNIPNVTAVRLFENITDATDADGVPPHAFEPLITGGADQAIFDTLFAKRVAGIPSHGTVVGSTLDSRGNPHVEKFSRSTPVDIFVRLFVSYDPNVYPSDGDAQVQALVFEAGAAQSPGRDAVPRALGALAFQVSGVVDVPNTLVYTATIPATSTAWVISTAYSATPGPTRSMVRNDGRYYICTTTGTSAASGSGPLGTGSNIVDGTVLWDCLEANIVLTSRQEASYTLLNIGVTSTAGTP